MQRYLADGYRPLTPREREMLRCLAAGMRRAEIASELWIAETTVMFHLRNMRAKLGARTLAHAVALGYRDGELA